MTDLVLRPLAIADAGAMTHVLAAPALYAYTGGEPPTRAELEQRYAVQTRGRSADGSETWLNLVAVLGEAPIGYVQATIPADGGPAEIAWVIGEPWQGRGHATRAARLLVEVLATRGVSRLAAHIHPEHAASQGIARRLGMARTGVVDDGEDRWEGAVVGVRA